MFKDNCSCRHYLKADEPPDSRTGRLPRQAGFTFAEVLAAMVFVAVVIPVTLHGIALANRAQAIAERKLVAARLAEKILNEIVITEGWSSGNQQGDFGEEWPDYLWQSSTQNWSEDSSMKIVLVSVFFEVQSQLYQVDLYTLVDDSEES